MDIGAETTTAKKTVGNRGGISDFHNTGRILNKFQINAMTEWKNKMIKDFLHFLS